MAFNCNWALVFVIGSLLHSDMRSGIPSRIQPIDEAARDGYTSDPEWVKCV